MTLQTLIGKMTKGTPWRYNLFCSANTVSLCRNLNMKESLGEDKLPAEKYHIGELGI